MISRCLDFLSFRSYSHSIRSPHILSDKMNIFFKGRTRWPAIQGFSLGGWTQKHSFGLRTYSTPVVAKQESPLKVDLANGACHLIRSQATFLFSYIILSVQQPKSGWRTGLFFSSRLLPVRLIFQHFSLLLPLYQSRIKRSPSLYGEIL